MKVVKSIRFLAELDDIVMFIADDSPSHALNFLDTLLENIDMLPQNPYCNRQKISMRNKDIRELIFKGYTIPYLVDNKQDTIVILGIFNQNLWE